MVDIAYRAYNDGHNIVAVGFPEEGGGAIFRKAIPLSAVGLACAGTPPTQYDMPFGTFRLSQSAINKGRGGAELIIDFESERVSITPITHVGNRIEEYTVRYTFDGLGIEDQRETEIQKAKSQSKFRVHPE